MEVEAIAGYVAVSSSILFTCLGLPVQIRHLYRVKSSKGISAPMMMISFWTFLAWVAYGAVKAPVDWLIIVANLPGAVFGGAIVWLIFRYRERKESRE